MTALAIDGGTPIRATPLPAWPQFTSGDAAAAGKIILSGKVNYWTGSEGRTFEGEFAEFVGCKHAVAVANGSVALEVALRALGVGPGDEVVVTPRSFIASASAAVLIGATPRFADVDPVSQNITAASISPHITANTKAILAVHHAGWPCDLDDLARLAQDKGLALIEDCAQAQGATYRGRPVGSFGDIATFSFCNDKIMCSAGEGGVVVTNRSDLWERVWAFKDHGRSYALTHRTDHPPGYRWLCDSFGSNLRMTEVQAAIGRRALRRVPEWLSIRRAHGDALTRGFADIPGLRVTEPPAHVEHAYYKYFVFIRPDALRTGWNRDRVMTAVAAEGIPCFSGGCPELYREPAFVAAGRTPGEPLPVARELGETSLMVLCHPTLSESDIADTVAGVQKVMNEAC